MAAYDRRTYKGNVAYTVTLATDIAASDATIPISDGSTFPDGSAGPFTITLAPGTGEEKVKIASRSGNTLTVAASGRGYDGTSAASHSSGASVVHTIAAVDLDEANQLVHALLTGGTTGQVATVDTTLTPPIKLAAAPVTSFNGGTGAIAQANGYGISGADANPPTPKVGLTSVSSFITSFVALAANTPANVTSLSLAAGTWLVLGQAAYQATDAAATLEFEAWLTTTTAGAGSTAVGGGVSEWSSATVANPFLAVSFACIVTPGTTTTYFLVAEALTPGGVTAINHFVTSPVVTGLVAVRLA